MPDATDRPRATILGVIGGILLALALAAAFCYAGLGKYFAYTSIFVGIWQWVYVVPIAICARRSAHRGLRIGILIGAALVLALNIAAFAWVYHALGGIPSLH